MKGTYSEGQGAGRERSVDRKVLRANIRGKRGFWLTGPHRVSDLASITWRMVEDEEANPMSRRSGTEDRQSTWHGHSSAIKDPGSFSAPSPLVPSLFKAVLPVRDSGVQSSWPTCKQEATNEMGYPAAIVPLVRSLPRSPIQQLCLHVIGCPELQGRMGN